MRTIITTIILAFPLVILGQINFENPPWIIGCDTLNTEYEMNVCGQKSFEIADSLLARAYKKIILHLDKKYSEEKKNSGPGNDKSQFEYLEEIKAQRAAVLASQNEFIKLRDRIGEIIYYQYSQASMRPLVINHYKLELTVNQLNVLSSIIDEIDPTIHTLK